MDSVIQTLKNLGVSPEVIVILVSASPLVELRGGIPLGIYGFGLSWPEALFLSIIGNILPIMPILFLFEFITNFLGDLPIFRPFFKWLKQNLRKKGKVVERFESLGLLLFVAIPFVGTGAWTGSLIASFLELEKGKAFLIITLGVVIAGVIVTSLSLLGKIGLILALIILPTAVYLVGKL